MISLVQTLVGLLQRTKVHFEKVPAHRGIRGNEEADRLAKQGRKMAAQARNQLMQQEVR